MEEFTGLGADILNAYEASESDEIDGDFGIDSFANSFEDEFPNDNKNPLSGTFVGYSPEANRPIENRPWGDFSDRPKVWELNQPGAAQVSGLRIIDLIPRRNRKWVFHRLAGTPSELRVMTQTIQATRRITGADIDFDQWFEFWRNGFLDFLQNRSIGNYQITGEKQWGSIERSGNTAALGRMVYFVPARRFRISSRRRLCRTVRKKIILFYSAAPT